MGRIDRYLAHRLLAVWGLASLILVMVYWVNRAVALFDQLIADGQGLRVFLEFTALALPSIVKIVLPLAAFVATLYAVNRLSSDSELTVIRAAGASPWRIARPVLLFGLFVGLLVAVVAHVLAPASLARLAAREGAIAETATARLLREGEFVSPVAGLTLYVRDTAPDGEIQGLLLSDSRSADASVLYTAASAFLVRGTDGPRLVMLDGTVQRLDGATGRLAVTTFAELAYDLGPLLPGASDRRSSRAVWTGALLNPTPALAAATGRTPAQLVAEAHDRMAEALLAPVAALVAVAAMLVGPWTRFGPWRQVVGASALAVAVKGVESAAVTAVREDPSLWALYYAPAALGTLAAAALLWLAARPGRAAGERPAERAGAPA